MCLLRTGENTVLLVWLDPSTWRVNFLIFGWWYLSCSLGHSYVIKHLISSYFNPVNVLAATVRYDCVLVIPMLNFLLLITAHVLGGGLFHTQSNRPVDDYNSNNWTRVLPFMAELKSIAEHIQHLSSLPFWCLIQAKACIYLPAMSHCSSQVASCRSSISLWNKNEDPQFPPQCTRLLFQPGGHTSPWGENQKQTRLPVSCLRKDGINNNGSNTTDEADWPHIYTLFGLQIFGNETMFKWWKDPTQLHTKSNMTESASNKRCSSQQIVGMPAGDTWNRRHPACKLLYLTNNGFCVNRVCHGSSKAAPRRGTNQMFTAECC